MKPRALRLALLGLAALPLLAGSPAPAPLPSADLARILDDYWQLEIEDDLDSRIQLGLPLSRLPDVSEAGTKKKAAEARRILERLERIGPAGLSHEEWISRELAMWSCRQTVALEPHFPLLPQLTTGSLPLRDIHVALATVPLRGRADLDGYLGIARQYPGLVRQLRVNLEAQRKAGILPPKDVIDVSAPILRSFLRKPEEGALWVSEERLAAARQDGADVAAFQAEIRRIVTAEVNPALEELAGALESLRAAAPQQTGIGQYPGGEAAYRALVRFHTSLDVTPEEVHRRGLDEVARIDARMAETRAKLGFKGTREEFHRLIRTGGRFLAKSPEDVADRLMRPVRRIEPLISRYFLRLPRAPYGVKRLDPSLEGGTLTFGYYQVPTPADPRGYYFFNGSQLDQRPLINAAALIYHELVPGHHFQINLQMENASLPAFRRMQFHNAFVEGWGEYASELGIEMGLYEDPYDFYGRLGMDMFLATRLVVDTGMNHLGWPREKAVSYMLEHVLESETQIRSETLRYSADMPGQALGYKMGSFKLQELRRRAERELGARFDLRRFHDAVLGSGSMPLTVLEQHIDWWIGEEKKRR